MWLYACRGEKFKGAGAQPHGKILREEPIQTRYLPPFGSWTIQILALLDSGRIEYLAIEYSHAHLDLNANGIVCVLLF